MHRLVPAALVLLAAACGRPDAGEADAVAPAPPAPPAAAPAPPDQASEEGAVGVRELKGGLIVETTAGGRGHAAANGDRVRVHYEGRVGETGEVFASTRASGIPYAFTLGRRELIPAFDLALRGARAGADLKLTVPAELAYAEAGLGKVPPNAALSFDVHVVSVEPR